MSDVDPQLRQAIEEYVAENRQKKLAKIKKELSDLNITISELTQALTHMQNSKKNTRTKASTNTLDGYTRSHNNKEGK